MNKLIYSLVILSMIFFVGCGDDDSMSTGVVAGGNNNSGGGGSGSTGLSFSGETKPVFTENLQYKVVVSGGAMPYKVLGSNLGTEYFVKDTLIFTNILGVAPKLYSIDIQDTTGRTGKYSFISSPEILSLDLKDNSFLSTTVEGISDTIGGAIMIGSINYNMRSNSFVFSSSPFTAHDDLNFEGTIDQSGSSSNVSRITYVNNPPPIGPSFYFSGTYSLDASKPQSIILTFDSLKIPTSFRFDLNAQTTTPSASQTLHIFLSNAVNLELK